MPLQLGGEVSLEEEAGWHWNAAIAAVLTAGWLVVFALFTVGFFFFPYGQLK